MEWGIGEIKQVNGEWYQCVRGDICADCAFAKKHCNENPLFEAIGSCSKFYRKDATSVIFKKLEKVGEPYVVHDHSRNEDVTVQDYKLYKSQGACYTGHEILDFCPHGKIEEIVAIEIKQNKEDMEEKNNAKHSNSEKIGKNLKEFDLEAAKSGKPVCTRDGRKARIICFDYKGDANAYPILALISTSNLSGVPSEIIAKYTEDGRYAKYNNVENDEDLMMLPEKKEGWVNVYKDGLLGARVYKTRKEAYDIASPCDYVDTVKISWEE